MSEQHDEPLDYARAVEAILKIQAEFDRLPASANDRRYHAATHALFIWRMLSNNLVGWALEQIQSAAPAAYSMSPKQKQKFILYLLSMHEVATPPHMRTEVLPAVMFPREVYDELREALEALDLGETLPLLTPESTGKHGAAYTILKEQIRALEHVEFLVGRGMKKGVAEEMVARAYGASVERLRTWRKRELRQTLGDHLDRRLSDACAAGKLALHIESTGSWPAEPPDATVAYMRDQLSADPLLVAARRYRDAIKTKGIGAN